MTIKKLFDPSKNINRSIEKVITYGVSQEARLKSEISEYVVTDSIDQQFENLLLKMEAAMDIGGENEVGVWVSGFYGSGKSSFTKYLGLAFDDRIKIDGVPFIQHLQDRLKRKGTKSLLSNVAKRFPAAVLMLDLASEQVAGATMEEVSTVLFYKVLQWAGYSRNLKVAALERRLKKEGRYKEFLDAFKEAAGGEDWNNYRNDELVVDSLIPEIAQKLTEMQVTVAMNRIDLIWDQLFPLEQHRIVELLVERVIISPNELLVRMHPNGVENLALDVIRNPASARVAKAEEPAGALA